MSQQELVHLSKPNTSVERFGFCGADCGPHIGYYTRYVFLLKEDLYCVTCEDCKTSAEYRNWLLEQELTR